MKPTDLFFLKFAAVKSELGTRMLEALGEEARRLDRAIITIDALNDITDWFYNAQEGLAANMPRAKRVQNIKLTVPDSMTPGWLTADGVTLLTITRASAFIMARKDHDMYWPMMAGKKAN